MTIAMVWGIAQVVLLYTVGESGSGKPRMEADVPDWARWLFDIDLLAVVPLLAAWLVVGGIWTAVLWRAGASRTKCLCMFAPFVLRARELLGDRARVGGDLLAVRALGGAAADPGGQAKLGARRVRGVRIPEAQRIGRLQRVRTPSLKARLARGVGRPSDPRRVPGPPPAMGQERASREPWHAAGRALARPAACQALFPRARAYRVPSRVPSRAPSRRVSVWSTTIVA